MNSMQRFLLAPCAMTAMLAIFFAGPDIQGGQEEKRWEIKIVNKTGLPIFVNLQGSKPNVVSYPGIADSSSREKGRILQPPVEKGNLVYGGLLKDGSYFDQMIEGERSVTVLKAEKKDDRWVPGEQLWNAKILLNAKGTIELGPKGLKYRNGQD
jgi:hypothetical protein